MATLAARRDLPPDSVLLLGSKSPPDYLDRYSLEFAADSPITTDHILSVIFNQPPRWVDALLKTRDTLVKPFGLRTTPPDTSMSKKEHLEPGDSTGLFAVSHRVDDEIVMAEDDRHLNFRLSVHQRRGPDNLITVSLTTAVWFNNIWGKLYFAVIRPFHCFVAAGMLKLAYGRLQRITGCQDPIRETSPRSNLVAGLAILGSLLTVWMGLCHLPMAYASAQLGAFQTLSKSASDFLILLCLCVGILLVFVGLLSMHFSLRLRQGDRVAKRYFFGVALLFALRTVIELMHPVTVMAVSPPVVFSVALMSLIFLVPAVLARSNPQQQCH